MRIPGTKTARQFSRWVQARVFGGAVILGYHRVADVAHDEYEICVSPEHFAEQMEVLSKYANPMSLSRLMNHLKAGSLPAKSVAVTFDDGYVDNLHTAKPILEKFAIPATVFVCTGYAGREFWWDELERLVMTSESALGSLRLQGRESPHVWHQPEGSREAGLAVRRKFRAALYHFLLGVDIEEQLRMMDEIRKWADVPLQSTPARALNHEELLELAEIGLIELGSHTRHHPMLPQLSREAQKMEIETGKKDLEALSGKPVVGFAYPNGRATKDAKRLVRETGFAFACTSLQDVVRPNGDLYALTRFWQKNVGGENFLRGLRLWMNL